MRRKRNPGWGTWILIALGGFVALNLLQAGASQGKGSSIPAGNPLAFIPGRRYVEFKDGVYNVVFNGLVAFISPDKATAERTYNQMLGAV